MAGSLISKEQLDILAESALRQLQSGRSLDSVLVKLEGRGLSPKEAQDLGEKVYKIYKEMHEENQKIQLLHESYNDADWIEPMQGGLAGALIGALLWGSITFLTNHYFNVFAVFIGIFAGYGTYKFYDSKRKYERRAKVIAAICSIIGIIVGEILAFVSLSKWGNNPMDFQFYLYGSGELNFMRLLWTIIAIFAAIYKVPDLLKKVSDKNCERI